MHNLNLVFSICSIHGKPTKRNTCRECNAAYMRVYLRRRRREHPERAIWERARKRAEDRGLAFTITRDTIFIPKRCPVLGLELQREGSRSPRSPSLDRIRPELGYVPGNVRVISDRANRLKGNRTSHELRVIAKRLGPAASREYTAVATYVEREELLAEVRAKAAVGGRAGREWNKIAFFLDRLFRKALAV